MSLVKPGLVQERAPQAGRTNRVPPRTPQHARFAQRLRQAMERRGYNRSTLAAVLEVTPTMVGYWRAGRYLPQPYIAERMADTLDDAMLRAMVVQARTFRCGHCGKTFDRQQTRATYCSTACQRRAHGPGGKRFDPRQDAIDAMCRGCEPEGMCRDDACALRPFSPFLFVSLTRPRRAA